MVSIASALRNVHLTLYVVTDLAEWSLVFQLHLVHNGIPGCRSPVCRQTIIARDPFRADVRIDLHTVRLAVVGCGRYREVRERQRLFHEVRRLCPQVRRQNAV